MNRYDVFIKVIEAGSFTKAANELGYTQSAVSQMIQALEEELGTTLVSRSRKGISLTQDGEEFLPYLKKISNSYGDLLKKKQEMQGLENANIRIGTFTSVSSNWLPGLMKDFKQRYPSVHFQLQQGEYTSIVQSIQDGTVDFGFVNPDAATELETVTLKQDRMLAIIPEHHPLTNHSSASLEALSTEPFILLDQGDWSEPLESFKANGLQPNIEYRVIDDYTIMSMVESGLGISILSELVLNKVSYRFVKKETTPPIYRTIGIAYKNKKTMPTASRHFVDFIIKRFNEI
ncbi:LysR family transcriptional regulator [Oceanobacillus luteolus]|uniref:LysR family transcriptional regulator n=1 Tax=Oceanobacillus luteolus TaxID=1274358 RepID=UPI00203C1E3A|nr:LysR family transcriptional regulator [Oceanobacillus luteolus]MCM3740806.1 LysR family transcriptional regulator [Oceanobacillus luteolus]